MNHDKKRKNIQLIGLYIDLGFRFGIVFLVGFLLGWWLDGKFDTKPILTIIGLFLGFGSGLFHLYKAALDLENKEKSISDEE